MNIAMTGSKLHAVVVRTLGKFSGINALSFEAAKSAAADRLESMDNQTKLTLYALFKQATLGDCNTGKPGVLDFVAKMKWQAWKELNGTSKDDAISMYIQAVSGLLAEESSTISRSATPQSFSRLLSEEGILRLTLNRPSKKNAITFDMYKEWTLALQHANADQKVKLISITGAGEYFSSGNDLSGFLRPIEDGVPIKEAAESVRSMVHEFVTAFIDCSKPIVGLINGPAIGISVTTLGLYDYVLACDTATFHTPFSSLGLSPEGCSSFTFPRMMGHVKAADMLLFNRRITANEALSCGLVNRIVSKDVFAQVSEEILRQFLELPSQSLCYSKELLRHPIRQTLLDVNRAECDRLLERVTSPECFQAAMKFLQKLK